MGKRICELSLVLAAACGLSACNSSARELEGTRPVEQRAASVPSSPASGVPSAGAPAPSASSDGATWDKVDLEDDVPLCVFADPDQHAETRFLTDVRKQTLRANSKVTFGAFPSGCLNEACDAPPTLQCWVDDPGKSPEGNSERPNTLVVHSRLSYEHKRGSTCTTDCRPVIAGFDTPVLAPGNYTVKYGRRTFTLRIPSVLRTPCFKMD